MFYKRVTPILKITYTEFFKTTNCKEPFESERKGAEDTENCTTMKIIRNFS
jgi:hypothetical protein